MDFAFTEEQHELQSLARRIFEDLSTHERLKVLSREKAPFDEKLWGELAKAGLLGVSLPEDAGGGGRGLVEACLLLEEQGRTVAFVPLLATILMGAMPLAELGTPAQRELVRGVAEGRTILTAALVEPLNDDPLRPLTSARRDGEGWRLDGEKTCVPAGQLAGRVLVPAATDGGMQVFVCDPSSPGVTVEPLYTTNLEPQARITLEGARCDEILPGGEPAVRRIVDLATAGLCALQVGVCEKALRMTSEYTSTRQQFGKFLAAFQAVAQRAADAYIDVEGIRLTAWQAIWRLSQGLSSVRELAIAKFWAAEGGQRVVHAAQHLHGGIGVDVDYPLHRYFVWAKQNEITLGAATPQLLKVGAVLAGEPV